MSDLHPDHPGDAAPGGLDAPGFGFRPDQATAALAALSEGVVVQAASGEIVSCNPAAGRILGLTPDQMAGRTSLDLLWRAIHEDGSPFPGETHPAMVTLRTGESLRGVVMGVHTPERSVRWISINSEPIPAPDGKPVCVVTTFTDITDRKLAAEALRQSEEKFRGVIENIQDAYFHADRAGRFVLASPSAARMFGFGSVEEMIGTPAVGVYLEPEERDRLLKDLHATGRIYDREVEARRRDGSGFWVSMNVQFVRDKEGCIVGTEGVVRDITERKRAEERLRASEEAHRSMLQTAMDGFLLADTKGRVLEVNEAYRRMSGYSEAELLSMRISDVEASEKPEETAAHMQVLVTLGHDRFETRQRRKDGTVFDVEVSTQYKPIEEGRVVAFLRDITERKRAELALRESEARFRAVIDASPVPMALNDEQANITYLNPAFVQTFGYSVHDIPTLAEWWPRAYPDPDYRRRVADGWQARLEQATRTGRPFEPTELVVRTSHGTDRTVLVSASPLTHGSDGEHLVMLYDITDRRSAEDKRRSMQEDLTATLSALPDLMFDVDREGRLLDFRSPNSGALLTQPEAFLGKLVLDVLPPQAGGVVSDAIAEAVRKGSHIGSVFPLAMEDGEKWFELSIAAKGGPDGSRERFVVLSRDITERRQAQEEIRKLNEELEQRVQERTDELEEANEELDAFAHSVSHDLRAPLRAIEGFSGMLVQDSSERLNAEDQRCLEVVRTNARKMSALIDDLLRFSRVSRSEMRKGSIDMTRMVKELVAEIVPDAQGNRPEIRVDELQPASGDPALVRVVFGNLLSNAVKYSGKREHPVIEVGFRPGPGGPEYFVKDNGAGFDPKYTDKLFGVFQRLHDAREFEGTGIGLALVKRIVERHGGSVRAEGVAGEGATFYFTLGPAAPEHPSTCRSEALGTRSRAPRCAQD